MRIISTELFGVYLIEPELVSDERGFFARTFCRAEFQRAGLAHEFVQSSFSFNHKIGTIRGLHLQTAPHEENKLVRCTMGKIFDVVVDIRVDSPTFKKWVAFELSADNRHALYMPAGTAHGFQTLQENCEVLYHISTEYAPQAAVGIRYDDEQLKISWPLPVSVISSKDLSLPTLDQFIYQIEYINK